MSFYCYHATYAEKCNKITNYFSIPLIFYLKNDNFAIKQAWMVISEHIFDDFRRGEIDSLYEEAYPSLLAYAARMLTDDYALMAEDCVQDAVVECYNRKETFESRYQLKAFLFACIHNRAVSVLRKVRSKTRYLEEQPADSLVVEAGMIEQDALDMLFAAVDALPEKYREVFEASFTQGLSNAEAAQQLSLSLDGVKKRKAKMVALLREALTEHPEVLAIILTQAL